MVVYQDVAGRRSHKEVAWPGRDRPSAEAMTNAAARNGVFHVIGWSPRSGGGWRRPAHHANRGASKLHLCLSHTRLMRVAQRSPIPARILPSSPGHNDHYMPMSMRIDGSRNHQISLPSTLAGHLVVVVELLPGRVFGKIFDHFIRFHRGNVFPKSSATVRT